MIRDFGSMLAVGTVILFMAGLLAAPRAPLRHGIAPARQWARPHGHVPNLRVERMVQLDHHPHHRARAARPCYRPVRRPARACSSISGSLFRRSRSGSSRKTVRCSKTSTTYVTPSGSNSELGILVAGGRRAEARHPGLDAGLSARSRWRNTPQLQRANSLASTLTAANRGDASSRSSGGSPPGRAAGHPGLPAKRRHTRASVIFSVGDMSLIERRESDQGASPAADSLPPGVIARGGRPLRHRRGDDERAVSEPWPHDHRRAGRYLPWGCSPSTVTRRRRSCRSSRSCWH